MNAIPRNTQSPVLLTYKEGAQRVSHLADLELFLCRQPQEIAQSAG